MARAAKLDLRAFQQELATRLAAKTTQQVEQSRLGLVLRRQAVADPTGGCRRGHRGPDDGNRAADPALVSRASPIFAAICTASSTSPASSATRSRRSHPVRLQARLVLFGPRVGELRAGLVVHRACWVLRNLAELTQGEAAADAPAWYGARWIDKTGGNVAGNRPGPAGAGPGFSSGRAVDSPR